MKRFVKIALLILLKLSGVLALARWLTRKQLRIVCYHGISVGDQHEFAPLLFMRPETFNKRLLSMVSQGWRVIGLDEAVAVLRSGDSLERTAVITIDDGWASTFTHAAPLLSRSRLPATLYVTTYYAEHRNEVFNVALYYMVWKSPLARVRLNTGIAALDHEYQIKPEGHKAVVEWVEHTRTLGADVRQQVLESIARSLGLEPKEVFRDDRFRLVSPDQVRQLAESGIDIQLHTHRHRLPGESLEALKSELLDNRSRLEAWTGRNCDHFCYPSGIYTLQQAEWLQEAGIKSSTTCDHGHNPAGMHPQRLRRVLDRESWTNLEFEAALSGFYELIRQNTPSEVPHE